MDYASFRRFRDESVLRAPGLLRLDCMNTQRALAAWGSRAPSDARGAPSSVEECATAWSRATGWRFPPEVRVEGAGVRGLLSALLPVLRERTEELWIPEDVYPVYEELARASEFRPVQFATIPRIDWSFLRRAGPRAAVLIPVPFAPLGRWLEPPERDRLLRWLREGKDRCLVIDAAYAFDFATSRAVLEPLLASHRCSVLFSAAKSWLEPGSFGIAWIPEDLATRTRERIDRPGELSDLCRRLTHEPELPMRLERAFQRAWARIGTRVRGASRSWRAPATGYFGIIEARFDEMLSVHGIFAVPASVFGSTREDVSVVSCLHDVPAPAAAEVIA